MRFRNDGSGKRPGIYGSAMEFRVCKIMADGLVEPRNGKIVDYGLNDDIIK